MSTVVFNPTNETFDAQYIGETVRIKPDMKLKMDDPRARHILNELGARGLSPLEFGDDEEKVAAEGKKRNLSFKKKQVMVYNQMNEARRQQNMPYMEVPDQIREYSTELGIGIIEPYNIKDTEHEELASLRAERDEQGKQIKDLTNMVQRLVEAQEAGTEVPEEETDDEKEIATNRMKYIRQGKGTFEGWVKKNKELIGAWPEANQSELRTKYAEFYNKELVL